MSDDRKLINRVNEDFQTAVGSGSAEAYSKLSGALEKLSAELRGYAQKLAINDMKAVLQKLKNDENLSDEDLKKLKSWIVGDAEYYISKEHDLDGWIANLRSLMGEIRALWADHPDADRLLKLKSLTRDAVDTVADITFYVKQKESVEKFSTATKEIGESERVVLMSLLEQKISASRF